MSPKLGIKWSTRLQAMGFPRSEMKEVARRLQAEGWNLKKDAVFKGEHRADAVRRIAEDIVRERKTGAPTDKPEVVSVKPTENPNMVKVTFELHVPTAKLSELLGRAVG